MRASYDSSELRVNVPELQEKALAAARIIRQYRSAYEDLERIVSQGGAYWQGSASETARQEYARATSGLARELADLERYPRELLETADAYVDVEGQMVSIVEGIANFEQVLMQMPSFEGTF